MRKVFWFLSMCSIFNGAQAQNLAINKAEYFDSPTTSVLVFNDHYIEGHQGGIQIINHGNRIAANGDIRLEAAPGQWQAFSQLDSKTIDSINQVISVSLSYPNDKAASRHFNPISYPDLEFVYNIDIKAEGQSIRIRVNLQKALPKEWIGRVGFNLELFPGDLFGKKYFMDETPGQFPYQVNGPLQFNKQSGSYEAIPLAEGNRLTIHPGDAYQRLKIESKNAALQLIDGRSQHNNGWFIVRSLVSKGATENAIEWLISPSTVPEWSYGPVIHINQAGYLPVQPKKAVIECDRHYTDKAFIELMEINEQGDRLVVYSDSVKQWGNYQRYKYFQFDFSEIKKEGIYYIRIGDVSSESFQISTNNYNRGVWQPTLEYFLPVQMCHMRVNDRYRVWHGLCHMDDALMAPVDHVHFDGYTQGNSTLCQYQSLDHVPNLNAGGWHDAGDYDLRVESQGRTVYTLSLIYEAFKPDYDITTIDQKKHLVEMHIPDGKPDILQQIEHGTISIVNGYNELGRLYRGIICNDLRQYVILGDGAVMTNNMSSKDTPEMPEWFGNDEDDRWVFTEINPRRELQICAYLAAASRSLRGYNDSLSTRALEIAEILWQTNSNEKHEAEKVTALTELILSSDKAEYLDLLVTMDGFVAQHIAKTGWTVARVINRIDDARFTRGYMLGMQAYYGKLQEEMNSNPFGVPYNPGTWGSAWNIERFGVEQYYIYANLQNEEAHKYMLNSLDYVLGVHPGKNTTSFVSGVGTLSPQVAYGINRADWSNIPGGVISGTANIQPDFPELKEWPFLWQQTEYMVGGAASDFMFLVLATINSVN